MSVISYSTRLQDLVTWEFNVRPAGELDVTDLILKWPYPIQGGVQAQYLQKCRDGTTGVWNFWITFFQDIYGSEYPGATFDAGTYKIVSIVYDREQ